MIIYTVLDYDGEPVTIEEGEIYDADPPSEVYDEWSGEYHDRDEGNIFWDSDKCEWYIELDDEYGNDRRDYGMGWYDCN